jgi:hypothetical protein
MPIRQQPLTRKEVSLRDPLADWKPGDGTPFNLRTILIRHKQLALILKALWLFA